MYTSTTKNTNNRRKYKFKDEHFFDCIDTQEKAYYIGLLWADGCNYINTDKGKQAYRISISLQSSDIDILTKFATNLYENSIPVVIKNRHASCYSTTPLCLMTINSKHISTVLYNYGMTPKRTTTCQFPTGVNWTEKTFSAFLRGFFDGDGTISIGGNRASVGIIGTEKMMDQLNEMIYKFYGFKLLESYEDRTNVKLKYLRLFGTNSPKKLLDIMYCESTVHLERKYKKYLELCQIVKFKLENKLVPHKNITFQDEKYYRLFIKHGNTSHRNIFKTLEDAIKCRNLILVSMGRPIPY